MGFFLLLTVSYASSGTHLYSLCESNYSWRAIILGPQVPSMLEYLVEVSQAINSSCGKGSGDPTPNQASDRECCVISPGLYDLGQCVVSISICPNTAFAFDPGLARKVRSNSFHRAFVLHASADCLQLLPIYPCVHSLGQ
jgi:hypothetical protein